VSRISAAVISRFRHSGARRSASAALRARDRAVIIVTAIATAAVTAREIVIRSTRTPLIISTVALAQSPAPAA
jgi:hypothetical protein